jgi:hypothetical protein
VFVAFAQAAQADKHKQTTKTQPTSCARPFRKQRAQKAKPVHFRTFRAKYIDETVTGENQNQAKIIGFNCYHGYPSHPPPVDVVACPWGEFGSFFLDVIDPDYSLERVSIVFIRANS